MLTYSGSFGSFSVDDIAKAKAFYESSLGVVVTQTPMGLQLEVKGNSPVFVYPKDDHVPATFTVLNFSVSDIDAAVAELAESGVTFEHYEGDLQTDEKGIARSPYGGPAIAWFKDPAGNFLSVIEE